MNCMEDELALIDTNILVYAFDTSESHKHKISSELLEKCWKNEMRFAISLQNLSEMYIIITKKISNPIPKTSAKEVVQKFLEFNNWIKLIPRENTLTKAMELSEKFGINYWDALIASIMIENKIYTIYTENVKDFKKIENITSINPF